MIVMSFNVRSNASWKYESWDLWRKRFSKIVKLNSPELIFLQEVKIFENWVSKDLIKLLEETTRFEWGAICTGLNPSCKDIFNNAILYKKSDNIKISDISENYANFQNSNRNIQIIEIKKGTEITIGVNAHFRSGKNSSIEVGRPHEYDLKQMIALLTQLGRDYPNAGIFAAGDFNYDCDLLSQYFAENRVLNDWLLDDESITGNGLVSTTVTRSGNMGNPMDHFLFNSKIQKNIIKHGFMGYYDGNKCDKWNFVLGIPHKKVDEEIRLDFGDYDMSFADYHQHISDHFPIVSEIKF